MSGRMNQLNKVRMPPLCHLPFLIAPLHNKDCVAPRPLAPSSPLPPEVNVF